MSEMPPVLREWRVPFRYTSSGYVHIVAATPEEAGLAAASAMWDVDDVELDDWEVGEPRPRGEEFQ